MLEAIERMDGYTTGKNNGVSNPDNDALNCFFRSVLEWDNGKNPDSYLNCLYYMTCYEGLPDDLRKYISQCEKNTYASLTQARQYSKEESQKVR